jgi:hypothetical protein
MICVFESGFVGLYVYTHLSDGLTVSSSRKAPAPKAPAVASWVVADPQRSRTQVVVDGGDLLAASSHPL